MTMTTVRASFIALLGATLAIPTAAAATTSATAAGPQATARASTTTPRPASFDPLPSRLQDLDLTGGPSRADVQKVLDKTVADGVIGIVGRVDTSTTHRAWASGKRRVWSGLDANVHAKFHVASITKTMIATLVMQEIERGTWSLDTTVDQIWPGLLGSHGYITLEELLSHRSGIPDGIGPVLATHMPDSSWASYFHAVTADYNDMEFIHTAAKLPWLFEPGTNYSYANTGFVVLGQLLHRQTGKQVGTLLEQRIFKPAHMVNSSFPTAPGSPAGSLVDAGYASSRWYSLIDFNPELLSSAGAVISTTSDLNRFTKALLTGRLVKQATVDQMIQPRSPAPNTYGLGIAGIPDPCTPAGQPVRYLYGHDGASVGALSIALSSRDGTRQFSAGLIGRYFPGPDPYDVNEPLAALGLAACS